MSKIVTRFKPRRMETIRWIRIVVGDDGKLLSVRAGMETKNFYSRRKKDSRVIFEFCQKRWRPSFQSGLNPQEYWLQPEKLGHLHVVKK